VAFYTIVKIQEIGRRGDETIKHRLNMELDLQSLFGLYVHSCPHWLTPRISPPSSTFGLIYEDSIGQPRKTTSLSDPLVFERMNAKIKKKTA
jgi:hypothetical protein